MEAIGVEIRVASFDDVLRIGETPERPSRSGLNTITALLRASRSAHHARVIGARIVPDGVISLLSKSSSDTVLFADADRLSADQRWSAHGTY